MTSTQKALLPRLGGLLRAGAVAVIEGVFRWRSIKDINQSISARPILQQAMITGSVFVLLFAISLFAAKFGWVGLLVFWFAIVILVN